MAMQLFNSLTLLISTLDMGVQVWNGITINKINLSRQPEWFKPADDELRGVGEVNRYPYFDSRRLKEQDSDFNHDRAGPSTRTKRESENHQHQGLNISLGSNLTLSLSYQSVASLLLLQSPYLCLAILGLGMAMLRHGLSCQGARDSMKAIFLAFVPMGLLELVMFLEMEAAWLVEKVKECLRSILGYLCGTCIDRSVGCLDLLHFLPSKDPKGTDRLLSVSLAKLFFGSCLQLIMQTVILVAYTPEAEEEVSQILSIIFSCLTITKTSWDIINFCRKDGNDHDSNSCIAKLKRSMKIWGKSLLNYIIHLPIILSSLLFNTGSLVMAILVLGWYSTIPILLTFMTSLLILITPKPLNWLTRLEQKTSLTPCLANRPEVTERSIPRAMLLSWTNLFILSRLVEQVSHSRVAGVALLQPIRAVLNTILLATIISLVNNNIWFSAGKSYTLYNMWLINGITIACGVLLFVGVLHQVLLCTFLYNCNQCRKTTIQTIPLNETSVIMEENIPGNETENQGNGTDPGAIIPSDISDDATQNVENEAESMENCSFNPVNEITSNVNMGLSKGDIPLNTLDSFKHQGNEASSEEMNPSNAFQESVPLLSDEQEIPEEKTISDELFNIGLRFIAKQSNQVEEDAKEHFKGITGNGRVNKEIFSDTITCCYPLVDKQKLQRQVFGKNNEIGFRKLLLVVNALSNGDPKEKLKRLFKLVDQNEDDIVSREDLKEVIHEVFLLANERRLIKGDLENGLVEKAFEEMDTNKDGKVIESEFIAACMNNDFIVINCMERFASMYLATTRK